MTNLPPNPAEISVVLITMDNFRSLGQLLQYIQAQTAKARIEVVIVCPTIAELALDVEQLQGFAAFKVVPIGHFDNLHEPRIAAIRNATAPIVAFTEDHCFPAPEWAAALIEAHRGPWAAVGPIIGLANPQHYRAWASYFMQYGDWIAGSGRLGGESRDVAGHNSSYKRDVLLAYGADLDRMMVFETTLHEDLAARGHRLYVAADARSYHVFITRLRPFLVEHFHIGRLLAATRRRRWSVGRRLAYVLASPLIPLVRLYRILGMIRKNELQKDLLPGIVPPLLAGLLASAAGECAGYATGIGRAAEESVDLDMNRWRYVMDEDKAMLWSGKMLRFSPEPSRPGKRAELSRPAQPG